MNSKTGAKLSLNDRLVPESLRYLIPMVEKWGFADPSSQDSFVELMRRDAPQEVEAFNAAIESAQESIATWSKSLSQFDKPAAEFTQEDWQHPIWAFLACLKIRELTGGILTEEEERVRELGVNEGRRILLGDVLEKANAMYQQREFASFVAMLEPFADLLTKSQIARLEFAKKRMSQASQ